MATAIDGGIVVVKQCIVPRTKIRHGRACVIHALHWSIPIPIELMHLQPNEAGEASPVGVWESLLTVMPRSSRHEYAP